MTFIKPYQLNALKDLHSLVEHRDKFNLDFCELNVFETRQKAEDFHLSFEGFTVTSMLRGKKIMHLEGMDPFEYVPGETVMAMPDSLMRIDFPEAEIHQPTQCTALVIDEAYLRKSIADINAQTVVQDSYTKEWRIDSSDLILKNNREFVRISTRMLEVLTSPDPFKDFKADLVLKEMVLNLLRLQNYNRLQRTATTQSNTSPFHAVLSFIHTELTSDIRVEDLCRIACMSKSSFYRAFTEEYGISPKQLILEERLKFSIRLMEEEPEMSLKEIAYASGFNDPNYFARAFKKFKGDAPSTYRQEQFPIN